MPMALDTWPKLEGFAKDAGLEWKNRQDLIQQVHAIWPDFDLSQVKSILGDLFRDAFEWLKGIFEGGIWIHFDVGEDGKIQIRLTIGKNGPEATREPLTEKEGHEVLDAIRKQDTQAILHNPKLKKKTRLVQLVHEHGGKIHAATAGETKKSTA